METNFNFESQICTSIEQSNRLLALGLKKETADMYRPPSWGGGKIIGYYAPDVVIFDDHFTENPNDLPAWSLGRLVEIIKNCDFKTIESEVWRKELKIFTLHLLIRSSDDLFENAISVIEVLIHKGYFNKEYLEE